MNTETFNLGKVVDCILSLGVKKNKPPQTNNPTDALAYEYLIAKTIADEGEKRKTAARAALMLATKDNTPSEYGKHVVHDTTFTLVEAHIVANPRRLAEPLLLSNMCKRFNINIEQAQAFVDECKTNGDSTQTRLTVLTKRG